MYSDKSFQGLCTCIFSSLLMLQVSKLQSTTEEENRISELVSSEKRRSTLGSVLQTVVNYGRPLSSLSSRGKEQRASFSGKKSSIASPVSRITTSFGRGLCCMSLHPTCTSLYEHVHMLLHCSKCSSNWTR